MGLRRYATKKVSNVESDTVDEIQDYMGHGAIASASAASGIRRLYDCILVPRVEGSL